MKAVLDTGALVAVDKRDRTIGAILRVLQRDGVPVATSGAVVAQVWRDGSRQANLARILSRVDVSALDDMTAKRLGELLRQNRLDDLVDAPSRSSSSPTIKCLQATTPTSKPCSAPGRCVHASSACDTSRCASYTQRLRVPGRNLRAGVLGS